MKCDGSLLSTYWTVPSKTVGHFGEIFSCAFLMGVRREDWDHTCLYAKYEARARRRLAVSLALRLKTCKK